MNYPSLKVCGNPDKNAGDQVLYSLNGGNIVIHDYAMGDVPYFNVNITDYNVQYVFVPNVNVKSYSSIRDSYCLKMGIAIPRHYRLKDGVSPYDVLMDVYKTMKKENLSENSGMNFLQYNERMCDVSVFETLLQKYPLEEYKSAYRPMTGSSAALLVTNKISEFMKYPHYPELQKYSEVIVANGGAYPVRVPDLPIPRVPQFSLYVNDKEDDRKLSEKDKDVVIKFHNPDPRCFKSWPAVTLSMAEIISKRVEVPNVWVDWLEEKIYYNFPTPEPLTVLWRVEVKVNGVITNNVERTNFTVRLSDGSTKPVNQQGEFNLTGRENLSKPQETLYKDNDDYCRTCPDFVNESAHRITVYLKKTTPKSPERPYNDQNTDTEQKSDNNNKLQVVIVLPAKVLSEKDKSKSAHIEWYPGGKGEGLPNCGDVVFTKQKNKEGKVELWYCEVSTTACLLRDGKSSWISVETKKATYEGRGEVYKNKYVRKNRLEIKSNAERYLDLVDENWQPISFRKRHNKQIYSFMLLLVFALGIALGVNGERKWIDFKATEENENVRSAFVFYEQYRCLDNVSVTFEEIDGLYATMNDLSAEVRNIIPDLELMEERTEAYYKIVENIRNATDCDVSFTNELRIALEPTKAYYGAKDDLPPNLDYCRYLYRPDKYGGSDDKLKQAQDKFLDKRNKGEINSFTDIESITEGLEPEQTPTYVTTEGASGVDNKSKRGSGEAYKPDTDENGRPIHR